MQKTKRSFKEELKGFLNQGLTYPKKKDVIINTCVVATSMTVISFFIFLADTAILAVVSVF